MTVLALEIGPIEEGWAVFLTDGKVLARFRRPGAKRRALRYLAQTMEIINGR
jgi:hypothetical protein